ncbi:MAG: type VI secretion system baseplate subunit TssG [Janthinobacterium lividum]|uniref:type VI secretion system baseplate subunit TssG n=1 Tax=Pseudomonas sp. MWU16-30317 TaxID=2878095 RepID=UPI001CFA0DCB|nr:type VI secretion system baseplate subunit TssG [Pseudomonas sp. MWU16-30317]
MESPPRLSTEPVSSQAKMQAAPWEYDFFQALRRIECEAPHLPRIGHSRRLGEDALRLGQRAEGTFAPATLASLTPAQEDAAPRLEQFFFGLGGPNGPMPLALTEYVRDRERNLGDSTTKHFFDLFHHRLLSLFYRAWAEARPTISHDRPDDDYWSARLAALSGRGMDSLLDQGPITDSAKFHYSGHLAAQTRYPDGLRAILAEYFGVAVAVEEYVGQWLPLPDHNRLGIEHCRLGEDLCLGSHVWDRQHKFRLRLGPLSLERYMALLPRGELFAELAAWVREYQGDELDWDLNLVLEQAQVPAASLDGSGRLGFNTWLGAPTADAADLLLSRHYADSPIEKDSPHG